MFGVFLVHLFLWVLLAALFGSGWIALGITAAVCVYLTFATNWWEKWV